MPFRAVGHVMSSLFYPLLTFALLAVVIAYWAITAVYPLGFFWQFGTFTGLATWLLGAAVSEVSHLLWDSP